MGVDPGCSNYGLRYGTLPLLLYPREEAGALRPVVKQVSTIKRVSLRRISSGGGFLWPRV